VRQRYCRCEPTATPLRGSPIPSPASGPPQVDDSEASRKCLRGSPRSAGYGALVGIRLLLPALAGALLMAGCAGQEEAPAAPAIEQAAAVQEEFPERPTATGLKSRGPAEIVHSVDTDDKVVFITIDDGLYEDPDLLQFLTEERIPITAFLTTGTIVNWQYWKGLEPVASIQNHTVTHESLPSAADPQAEICGANEAIVEKAGQVPWMLRPPYGAYNA